MDAEMIILCDGVVIPQSKKEIDGGVAIAGGHILRIGARAELSDYLGVDTEVVEYHNSTLFTFDRTNTEGNAMRQGFRQIFHLLFILFIIPSELPHLRDTSGSEAPRSF